MDDETILETLGDYMRLLVKQRFTSKMLSIVDELNRAYFTTKISRNSKESDFEVFPRRAG
jgi:hypothetical protein